MITLIMLGFTLLFLIITIYNIKKTNKLIKETMEASWK